MKPVIKGIGTGLKAVFSGTGVKDLIPMANGISENIKEIKTDPVKRWEKIAEMGVKLILAVVLLYLIGKGVISLDDAKEVIEMVD